MLHTRTTLLLLLISVITFVAGIVVAIERQWGTPLATISVENETDSALKAVTLHYSSCGAETAANIAQLSAGEKHVFKFVVCGEGGYRIAAELHNGTLLHSPGAYVEGGFRSREHIEQTRIRSDVEAFR